MKRVPFVVGFLFGLSAYCSLIWQGEYSTRELVAVSITLLGIALTIFSAAVSFGNWLAKVDDRATRDHAGETF